jgi:hypothetical protein
MAASAHAAAMRAQDSHSPSKKMHKVGQWFSQGYAKGIAADAPKSAKEAAKAAEKAHNAAVAAAKKRAKKRESLGKWIAQYITPDVRKDASKTLDKVGDLIYKVDSKKQRQALKKLVNGYANGKKGLKALAAQQQALQDGNYLGYLAKGSKLYKAMAAAGVHNLQEATDRLKDLKQQAVDYASTVKSNVVSFGDITQLGKNGAGNATASSLIGGLKQRALRCRAATYATGQGPHREGPQQDRAAADPRRRRRRRPPDGARDRAGRRRDDQPGQRPAGSDRQGGRVARQRGVALHERRRDAGGPGHRQRAHLPEGAARPGGHEASRTRWSRR